ncbi:MAG TPA: hypothetical protein VFL47_16455, partial [Flavisolibacter sp.]|nr:hypothetical protein [Flavisolibacter sp.]
STSTQNKSGIGGMLRADLNWAFLPFMGIGAGGFAGFSSVESPVGFELKLMVGKMNIRKK